MGQKKSVDLNRRDFLKISGAASLSLGLAACGFNPKSEETSAPTVPTSPAISPTLTPSLTR